MTKSGLKNLSYVSLKNTNIKSKRTCNINTDKYRILTIKIIIEVLNQNN